MITLIPQVKTNIWRPFVMPAWEDKNLRIHDGDDVQIIACQLPPADGQPCLKVFGEEVGIVLLDPSANDASISAPGS